jgi:uncharacterized protein (DUF302 family)
MAYYREQKIEAPFDEAVEKVREALSEEGFSVPAEVDVTGAFQSTLEKEFRPYLILLAGDPEMAYEAMTQDPNVGAVLPANIAIYEADDDEGSVVAVMEPDLLRQVGNPMLDQMGEVMEGVFSRLFGRIAA